jgi:hypothetical protein
MVDSDCAGQGDTQDEQLICPVLDATQCQSVTLQFSNQFRTYGGVEIADVDVSTDEGATWTNVLRMQGSDDGYPTPTSKLLDISDLAAGQSMQVRFYYHNAHYEWWWAIDNLYLSCDPGVIEPPGNDLFLPLVVKQ